MGSCKYFVSELNEIKARKFVPQQKENNNMTVNVAQ